MLDSWAPPSSLSNFNLAWTTTTLLAQAAENWCSDLTLLCVDNQDLFHQHQAAIFVLASGGKTDQPGYHPPQIHIESHFSVSLCPIFYL